MKQLIIVLSFIYTSAFVMLLINPSVYALLLHIMGVVAILMWQRESYKNK